MATDASLQGASCGVHWPAQYDWKGLGASEKRVKYVFCDDQMYRMLASISFYIICGRIGEKGPYCAFPNFHFKMFITQKVEQLQTWTLVWMFFHHPATLVRNSEPRPFPVWPGRAHTLIMFKKLLFYASLWRLTTQGRRLAVASNVGSVK